MKKPPKEEIKLEEPEAKKEVKFMRFNVPYIQGEIQSLTPRKKWADQVANLESQLELEKRKNIELNKKVASTKLEILNIRNEYEAKLLNIRNDGSIADAKRETAYEKIRSLEIDNEQLERSISNIKAQYDSRVKSMEQLISSQKIKIDEMKKELIDKSKQVESLTIKNTRLTAKVDEDASMLNKAQKNYQERIAKVEEEKHIAMETADNQGVKLIQAIKESKLNLARYQQSSDELNELKESLKNSELNMKKLKDENIQLKIKLRLAESKVDELKEQNESLIRNEESLRIKNEALIIGYEKEKEIKINKNIPEEKKNVEVPIEISEESSDNEIKNINETESKTYIENIMKQKEIMHTIETIKKIESEKSLSNRERAAFEEDLINRTKEYSRLQKDFQEYRTKIENEIEKLEDCINQQHREIKDKDIIITELKTKLEAAREDGLWYKENYSVNSYLRNLPRTGLWSSNKEIQKGINDATKRATVTIGKDKAKSTIRQFEEDVESIHENNKKTIKKQYSGKANDILKKNDREIEDQLEEMERKIDSNLGLEKNVESYLSEFN